MKEIYTVNGTNFESFFNAVNFAKEIDAEVYEIANGLRRWAPIPKKAGAKVRHVLIMPDGTKREIGKVRR